MHNASIIAHMDVFVALLHTGALTTPICRALKHLPLAMVRRWLWADQHFQMSQTKADMIKVPRSLFERLTETLCYVA
jgi:hypothetical protein